MLNIQKRVEDLKAKKLFIISYESIIKKVCDELKTLIDANTHKEGATDSILKIIDLMLSIKEEKHKAPYNKIYKYLDNCFNDLNY